jgi:FMN phosphatase YigB (HAD superfamily)
MNSIKFIYFDVGGVLLNWTKALTNLSEYLNEPYDKVVDIFNKYDDDASKDVFSLDQSWQYIKSDLETKIDIPNFQEWWLNNFTPIIPMHNLVKEIMHTYRVGIITNIHKGSFAIALKKHLIPNLPYEIIIESCDLKLIKPHEDIFLHAQKKAGVLPNEILFVDDYLVNTKTAEKLGWNVVLFDENSISNSIKKIQVALRIE